MEGVLKKKVSILRGFEDKWFELKNDGFLECYEVKTDCASNKGDVPACNIKCSVNGFARREGGLFGWTWETKFFVLCDAGFLYFDSGQMTTPRRSVPLKDIKGVANADGYGNKEHVFQIATKNKTFHIEVDTAEECKRWMTEISACLKKFDSMLLNKDNRVLKDRIYVALASLSSERDDRTFKIVTNSGGTHIMKAISRTERQQWLDKITEAQRAVKKKTGPFGSIRRKEHDRRSGDPNGNLESKRNRPTNEEIKMKTNRKLESVIGNISTALKRSESFGSADNMNNLEDGESNHGRPISRRLSDRKMHSKENCLLVASIDFGSFASGCAFSTKSQFKVNPLNITILPIDGQTPTKSPTILLLHPDGEFAGFGTSAQEKFSDLASEEKDKEWYYFRRFKMQLYKNKNLKEDMVLIDVNDREMNASDVFAICIENIKNKVFERASEAVKDLKEEQIHWMITVPAIWSDPARQFMIYAAEKAGINRDLLSLVLEPEAAAVFCKHIEISRTEVGKKADLQVFEPGSQFMVVDLGGGTVDITCNEVLESRKLREVYNASGGPWGGNMINLRIWKHIRGLFGNQEFDKFMKENTDCNIDLLKAIEVAKMNMKPNKKNVLAIPHEVFQTCTFDNSSEEIDENKSRVVLSSSTVSEIFKKCLEQVCTHLEKVLNREENAGIKTMLLVGGYSACEMLKNEIKTSFPNFRIICPVDSPDTIVLRGAVLMGHESRPIVGRRAKCNYGLSKPEGLRIVSKVTSNDSDTNDEFVYLPLINKGEPIVIGDQVAQYTFLVESDTLQETEIHIITCEEEIPPTCLSETFTRIGKICVRIPELCCGTEIAIVVSCEETEFKISAVINETGQRFCVMCTFLL